MCEVSPGLGHPALGPNACSTIFRAEISNPSSRTDAIALQKFRAVYDFRFIGRSFAGHALCVLGFWG